METKNNTENTANCPLCGNIGNYNLKKWPPTEDKKNNTLNIKYHTRPRRLKKENSFLI